MKRHVLNHRDEGLFLIKYNGYTKDHDNLMGDTKNFNDDIQAHATLQLFLRTACGVLGWFHGILAFRNKENSWT